VAEDRLDPQLNGHLEGDVQPGRLDHLLQTLVVGVGVLDGDEPEVVAADDDRHHQPGRPVPDVEPGRPPQRGRPLGDLAGDVAVGRVEGGPLPALGGGQDAELVVLEYRWGADVLGQPGQEQSERFALDRSVRTAASRRGRL